MIAPGPGLYERAGILFREIYDDGRGLGDRLGALDDLLIALTAWHAGARVVTSNATDFRTIARHLPGLVWAPP